MNKSIFSLVIALGVAMVLPAQEVEAKTIRLPSYNLFTLQTGMNAQTVKFLESYYGVTNYGFRSQRGRTKGTPVVLQKSHYVNETDFTDQEMLRYDQEIFKAFERIGVGSKHAFYENETYSDSEIDIQALVSHECFDPIRGEIEKCIKKFGPYYNIQQSILDGSLRSRLAMSNSDVSLEALNIFDRTLAYVEALNTNASKKALTVKDSTLPPVIVTTGGNAKSVNGATSIYDHSSNSRMRMNAEFIWEVCKSKYNGWREQNFCYIRNKRFILDPDSGIFIDASDAARFIN